MGSAREVALLTLTDMDRQKAWSNARLKKAIREAGLDRRDAALATRLCFGVLQNRLLLDFYLAAFSSMKLEKMESKVRNNLRIGLYQMLFLDKIPNSAAVSEAVELTKKHCKNPRAPGMVNGILRNIIRKMDSLPPLDRSDRAGYLSLFYSHPKWLTEAFAARLPDEELEALLRWDNGEPPVTVQVNTAKTTAEAVIASLEAEGVQVEPHPWLPGCLILTSTGDLAERTAYRDGLLYAQDPAARLAVLALDPKPGDRLLDACAAPGGKSFAAALSMEDTGEIVSCDVHPHKKKLIAAGAKRLGLEIITPRTADATEFRPDWEDRFDAVLADVPCSGLGVIRKKPEIRYKDPKDLAGLPPLQLAILSNVSRYVRPGGTLLYATCTLLEAENEGVAEAFLAGPPDFRPEAFTLPGPLGTVESGQCTLWPQRLGTDGFFLAKFRREGGGGP